MRRLLPLALLLAAASSLSAQSHPKVTRLDFMAGCWEGALGREDLVQENWTSPTDNMMLATTRYLNKDKQATGWEFTRIVLDSMGVAFIAAGNGEPEHRYALTTISTEYVLFENLAKPFPQKISYRMASDGALIARNEGEGQLSVEVRFERVRCPGDRR
ncbi:MAG: hypothetical protein KJZ47_07510 [Gemmatimonadales bacterium]|nr:hypothetical protein [Gemmatimonadales bacterium]